MLLIIIIFGGLLLGMSLGVILCILGGIIQLVDKISDIYILRKQRKELEKRQQNERK
ncbi:MAG: hypothetical protein ACRDBY_14305 [Cetobacterium sp.]